MPFGNEQNTGFVPFCGECNSGFRNDMMQWINLTKLSQHVTQRHKYGNGNLTFTVANLIFNCGVTYGALFKCNTKSDRMTVELFDGEFSSCMDKMYKEFYEDLQSYSSLTILIG